MSGEQGVNLPLLGNRETNYRTAEKHSDGGSRWLIGCKSPPPGYCFTIEYNNEYTLTDIDLEYCEQVEEMAEDSAIIQFKRLPAVPKALCKKHCVPYERFYESFTVASHRMITW